MRSLTFAGVFLATAMLLLIPCFHAEAGGWSSSSRTSDFWEALQDKNLEAGAWKIHPYSSLWFEYDDNVFLEATGEKDDLIMTISPGILLELPFNYEECLFQLDYEADVIRYSDWTDQNDEQHRISALLDMEFGDYGLTVKDVFRDFSDVADTEFTSRVSRKKNVASVNFEANFNRLKADLNYENVVVDYSDLDQFDRTDNVLTLTGYTSLFPKTDGLFEYRYADISYDDAGSTRDGSYNQLRAGLKGELTGKLSALIKAGYQNREYDLATKEDWKEPVAYTALTYNISELTSLNLFGERTAQESTYSSNNFYEITKLALEVSHELSHKVTGTLGTFLQNNKYPEQTTEGGISQKREDDLSGLTAGLKYDIQEWLSAGLEYQYSKRDSNFEDFDYTDNKILVTVSVSF